MTKSEAYLEGMKTGLFVVGKRDYFPSPKPTSKEWKLSRSYVLSISCFSSEAYLEGMKTQDVPDNRVELLLVRSLPRRNENCYDTHR